MTSGMLQATPRGFELGTQLLCGLEDLRIENRHQVRLVAIGHDGAYRLPAEDVLRDGVLFLPRLDDRHDRERRKLRNYGLKLGGDGLRVREVGDHKARN